jgi:capsular polysaccharide biosynthesis protein
MNSSATIISFYATTTDPELSMAIADAVAQSYSIEMNNILNNDSVKLLDSAYTYYKSYSAKRSALKKVIMFVAAGIVLACVMVLICEVFDTKVRTVREATINGKLPVIGIIPDYKE